MSIILSIKDRDMDLFKKQYLNLPELHKEIEQLLEDEKLIDGIENLHDEWKMNINFLIDMYNLKSEFRKFEKIK